MTPTTPCRCGAPTSAIMRETFRNAAVTIHTMTCTDCWLKTAGHATHKAMRAQWDEMMEEDPLAMLEALGDSTDNEEPEGGGSIRG